MDNTEKQNKSISFKSSAESIEIESSTNKMYLIGCIATIDEASEGSPCGADGKKIILSSKNADKCIKSFKGQPMNCLFENWGCVSEVFTGHGNQYWGMYFGYIEDAWQEDKKLMAKIVVWKNTFPELASTILNAQRSLGFSIEIYPTQLYENEEGNMVIDEWEAFGCALLWRNCAAFGEETYIEKLVASLQKSKDEKKGMGDANMTDEQLESAVSKITAKLEKTIDEKIAGLGIDEIKSSIESLQQSQSKPKVEEKEPEEVNKEEKAEETKPVEASNDKQLSIEDIKSMLDNFEKKITASQNIPQPKSFAGNSDIEGDNAFVKELSKIDASNMSDYEKLKAKAHLQIKLNNQNVKLENIYKPLF